MALDKNFVICGLYNNQLVPLQCNPSGQLQTTTGDFSTEANGSRLEAVSRGILMGLYERARLAIQCNANGELE